MPSLAVLLQYKDGSNIALQTNGALPFVQAVQLSKDFYEKIAKIRQEDFGPLGPSFIEPHFSSGKLNILTHYQAVYTLFQDIYLVIFQHISDNPFHSDSLLSKIKTSLISLLKTDKLTRDVFHNKYSDILHTIEKCLDGTFNDDKDDWFEEKESQYLMSREQVDFLSSIEFEIPTQWLRNVLKKEEKSTAVVEKKKKKKKKPKRIKRELSESIQEREDIPPPPPPDEVDYLDIIPPPPPEEEILDFDETSIEESPPPPPPDDSYSNADSDVEMLKEFEALTDSNDSIVKDEIDDTMDDISMSSLDTDDENRK